MRVVHSQLVIPEKVVKPTKKQLYHTDMETQLRRRQFVDFQTALKDPEILELIKQVQKISPGWMPKFRK
ncbi:hypothetical protein J3L18_00185 [Mucilaginibacter gossypii]|uniref:hypothetical protein n=1 Tax=Mucilaginibacter gossypii TaxID=551996 RepID=UPI000DCEB5D4|nr:MULTISPECIES: hypothetical protein [Mucilaginibacter]QTE37521.1 hypothetical protein J3L18_00185 [Mucilaginibacter gossypii]RAV52347.1 hypothetical protein DIU36_24745 [Mucilaginibacter rubeus]